MTTLAKSIWLICVILGDIHLGSTRVSTLQIIKCLVWAIKDDEATSQINILYLSGDLFDRLLSLNSSDVQLIISWMTYLLKLCKRLDIQIRLLEGTPSHDWKQNQLLVTLNDPDPVTGTPGIGANLLYFTGVKIEYNERYSIYVLYIPDLKVPADEMWQRVQDELRVHGIQKVHYTVMHGAFPFQMPPAGRNSIYLHDPDKYADLTEFYVFANHIHIRSSYRNIVPGGSLERLRHGEEHPKGYMKSYVNQNDARVEFIENPHTTMFKTIDLSGVEKTDVVSRIESLIEYRDREANIRIFADRSDEVYHMIDKLKMMYPWVTFTFDPNSKKKAATVNSDYSESLLHVNKVVLTKDNLKDELTNLVVEQLPDKRKRCDELLEEIIK